jgi:hypothetical protein
MNTRTCLPLAMMFAVALAAPNAVAQTLFSAWVDGQEIDTLQGNPPTKISVDGSLTGTATQLGQFTLTYKVTVNLADGSATGSAVLTTANGDTISTTLIGQGIPVNGSTTLNRIVEINTITAGTGKFAGAKGSFITHRMIDLASGLTFGSLHGAITLPSAAN